MDFLELTRVRYSVRGYSERKVEKEKIDKILEAGNNAPTACNFQPQRIFVIQSDEAREKVKKITPYHFDAPCYLMVCYNEEESWFGPDNRYGHREGYIDPAIVVAYMMLEAAELGLGSVWVGAFHSDIASKEFDLPKNIVPVALMPIGYPSGEIKPVMKTRKDISEIAEYI
ncbi:MAG: nitroreductase family protein [Clostridiaceae bacterium]